MSFQDYERIVAIDPAQVEAVFGALVEQFGEVVADGTDRVRTIGAFWDDAGKARIRAADPRRGTIAGLPLTDGRVAFRCLWQADLAAAWEAGQIPGVAELTAEEFGALRVVDSIN